MPIRTRAVILASILVGAAAASQGPPPYAESQWRTWFTSRSFRPDPYFFFPRGESGATECPEVVRLTLLAIDSTRIELGVDEDQPLENDQRTHCRVRYDELRGRPERLEMEADRVLWRLLAVRSREPRSTGDLVATD